MVSTLAPTPLATILRQRRQRLAQLIDFPVVLWSGQPVSRNFPALTYPFRANSHFLYFAGMSLANAAIHLEGGRMTLFMDEVSPQGALWHGPGQRRAAVAAHLGAEAAYPLTELPRYGVGAATVPVQDARTIAHQQAVCPGVASEQDQALVQAIVTLRLQQDTQALEQIRAAAAVTVAAHRAGMAATPRAHTEAQIRAAMEQVILGENMAPAYNSIVTVHGEVLHNEVYHHPLTRGDLLLADVGAETEGGWASDVTRTWPVSGQFSSTQRDIYDLVLAAHDACIAAAKPGVEYRDLHLLACGVLAAGLVDLGILVGNPEDLVAQDAHSLFFPHGVGHLLGLDVHDMEDLGDRAGYAPGRQRSDRFGLGFLRLDRPLQAGMTVTIEPGFYQVPAILADPERRDRYRPWVRWDRLATFADVRGIRIEDDVLITPTGAEVLTAALPSAAEHIEALVQGSP